MHPDNSLAPAPAPPSQFPPGYQERFAATIEATGPANIAPLPGPLLEAWLPSTLIAAGFKLRPVVAADWPILQRINSPLLTEMAKLQKPEADREPVRYEDEEIWDLVYLWTVTPREARAALAPGLHSWRETVMSTTADVLPAGIVAEKKAILAAIAANLMRALSTSVSHGAPTGPDGPVNFTKPPAEPMTGSAGG